MAQERSWRRSPRLWGVLILGYSALEGIGSALMIPPIYIFATMLFDDLESRARAFGMISGMAGVGAAAGPLIGGLITTAISWRVTFLVRAAIVGLVVVLSRRIVDPLPPDKTRRFDTVGAVLSAAGMFFVVIAILQIGVNCRLSGGLDSPLRRIRATDQLRHDAAATLASLHARS